MYLTVPCDAAGGAEGRVGPRLPAGAAVPAAGFFPDGSDALGTEGAGMLGTRGAPSPDSWPGMRPWLWPEPAAAPGTRDLLRGC